MEKKIRISTDQAKKIELEILVYFYEFCKAHSLRMYLFAGTLLGAIRHKGFIPWDDDIDVCMPREDYDKLLRLGGELDPHYRLLEQSIEKRYKYPFAKIMKNDTLCVEFENPKFCGMELGIYIDVFPVDFVGDTEEEALANCKHCASLVNECQVFLDFPLRGGAVARAMRKLKRGLRRIRKRDVFDNLKEFISSISQKRGYCASSSWLDSEKSLFSASGLDKSVDVEFEGYLFPAFCNYKEYLTHFYGDYMKLPPEEERTIHGFDAYIFEGQR